MLPWLPATVTASSLNAPDELIATELLVDTLIIVKAEAGFVVLLAASLLGGCGTSSGNLLGNASDLTGNWQIETSASAASASPQGVVLMGGLESSGNQVSGTFRFTNLAQPVACGSNQVVLLSGAVGPDNDLTLSSATLPNNTTIRVSLKLGNAQPYSGLGKVEVDGGSCAVASASAIGSQVATATGKFVGTLSPGTSGASGSGMSGTATATLTQSATAGSDGQFALTGTLNYQFASCSGSVPLNGKVSGVGMNFWDVVFTSSGGQVQANLVGTTNLTATQIKVGYLSLAPAPCSADPTSSAAFNGQMIRK
ncbi:MAG: hypothetical protein ACRD25_12320 [Terracidiphilus sp.]